MVSIQPNPLYIYIHIYTIAWHDKAIFDDCPLYTAFYSTNGIVFLANLEICDIRSLYADNKLHLNYDKTEILINGVSKYHQILKLPDLRFGLSTITSASYIKCWEQLFSAKLSICMIHNHIHRVTSGVWWNPWRVYLNQLVHSMCKPG